jgi:hypothetical protein
LKETLKIGPDIECQRLRNNFEYLAQFQRVFL